MKWLDSARDRYQALETRERRFLVAAVVAIMVTILYLAVIEPLFEYRGRLESGIQNQREQVAWMRGAVEVLRQRGPVTQPRARNSNGSLLALADSSARSAGLSQPLKRIQQDGNDAVRVRLESASFDQLILWLDQLERRHGVIASEMSVDRADREGLVNASLTLSRAAS